MSDARQDAIDSEIVEEDEAIVNVILPFTLFSLLLGVIVSFLLSPQVWRAPLYKPPFTVTVFLLAVGAVAVNHAADDNRAFGDLGRSILLYERAHPHVILLVFLPIILFKSAYSIDFHVFYRVGWSSLLLAVPGVMMSSGLTMLAAKLVRGAWLSSTPLKCYCIPLRFWAQGEILMYMVAHLCGAHFLNRASVCRFLPSIPGLGYRRSCSVLLFQPQVSALSVNCEVS